MADSVSNIRGTNPLSGSTISGIGSVAGGLSAPRASTVSPKEKSELTKDRPRGHMRWDGQDFDLSAPRGTYVDIFV